MFLLHLATKQEYITMSLDDRDLTFNSYQNFTVSTTGSYDINSGIVPKLIEKTQNK